MVEDWMIEAMRAYNATSFSQRDAYPAVIHMPGEILADLLNWCFQALPDEILVGLDVDEKRPNNEEVDEAFTGDDFRHNLFAGQGFVIGEAQLVNRGDSYSVHHVPEEWTDGLFAESRGSRGSRFTHWLHTHPNAPALPSGADADAAQGTLGVDMILGVEFSPEGPLPWFDDIEGERRRLAGNPDEKGGEEEFTINTPMWRLRGRRKRRKAVLGKAPTGHSIHGLELISFHRTGFAVNVVLVDEKGLPYGWPFEES